MSRRTVTSRKMYKWVSAYPRMSGYWKMSAWPTYEQLCEMFNRLVESKNIGYVLSVTYPDLKKEGDKFTYENSEND